MTHKRIANRNIVYGCLIMYMIGSTTPAQSSIAAPQAAQQEQQACREAARELHGLIDTLRSTLNSRIISLIKKMPADQQEAPAQWTYALGAELMTISEALQNVNLLSPQKLLKHAATVALYLETMHHAIKNRLHENALLKVSTEQIAERITEALDHTNKSIEAYLADLRAKSSPEDQAKLPTTINEAMIKLMTIGNFVVAIKISQESLAQMLLEYGLTKTNKIARLIDLYGKRFIAQSLTPFAALSLVTIGGSYALYRVARYKYDYNHSSHTVMYDIASGAVYHGAMSAGGSALEKVLKASAWSWSELKNQTSAWWNRIRGFSVQEKNIDGFLLLNKSDCGEQEPLIGLEHQCSRILNNIESSLRQLLQGDPEPFKNKPKAYIFIGLSGGGKTYLADQLKIRIAELKEAFGIDLAYEHIGPETLLTTDIKSRVKAAQDKGLALILWIDEMHLLKPQKDGNSFLLWQLLQTEEINKSNAPVWIFTATNEPGRFDMAMVRAGRFEIINIYELVLAERARMFDYYLKEQGLILSQEELQRLAASTHKASPAEIRKVINAARISGKAITKDLIEEEIMQVIYKIVPGFEKLSAIEQREVAIYQAGKGLTYTLNLLQQPDGRHQLRSGQKFVLVTAAAIEQKIKELAAIILDNVAVNKNYELPRRVFGSVFTYSGREDFCATRTIKEKTLMIQELLAGSIAQEIILGADNIADDMRVDDFKKAYELARDIARNGSPFEMLSRKEQQRCLDEAKAIITTATATVKALLTTYRPVLEDIAHMLLRNKMHPHVTAHDLVQRIDKHNGTNEPSSQQ